MKLKALKIRIYPNKSQAVQFTKTFGCCRFLYNSMLAERIEVYERLKDSRRELFEHSYKTEKQYKEEFEFLKEVDSIALQQARKDLSAAYQNFFKRCKDKSAEKKGFPRFKKKNDKNSFRVVKTAENLKIDFIKKKIKIPKITWISFRDNRVIKDIKIHSVTVSKTKTNKYFASVLYEDTPSSIPQVDLKAKDLRVKGLDMSLTEFFVDNEGNSPMFRHPYREFEKKIVKLQKKIEAEKIKSKRKKLRLRLNKVYEHVTNIRKDFIEKLSTKLVKENDVICIESLSLKDMARFRKWEERKNSTDKSNHGKSVNDLGWYMFTQRLKTKADEKGKAIIEADKWFASSKTCSKCGYVKKDLVISERTWICPQCGTEHLRDQNAAINLMNIFTEGTSGSASKSWNGNRL